MRDWVRVCWAYLARDAAISTSYRLDFALRLGSMFFFITILYFVSQFIGASPALDRYGGYMPFAAVGMALASFFQSGFTSFSSAVRNEQMTGTLEAVLLTPARLPAIVLGSSLWSFAWGLLTILIYLGAVRLLFNVHFQGSWPAAAALVVFTTLVFSCLGVISASFTMAFKRGDPLPIFVSALSTLFGGVYFPVEVLPRSLQHISHLLPITYGLRGLREVLLRGESFADVMPEIGILLLFAAVTLPLSAWCFARAVRHARREGSLLVY